MTVFSRYGVTRLISDGNAAICAAAICLFVVPGLCSPARAGEPEETPLYEVPLIEDLVIDAKVDDWGDDGFRVEAMAHLEGREKDATDLNGRFRLAWDSRGLLLLFQVKDSQLLEHPAEDSLWQRDAVEIYVANKRGGKQMVQVLVTPGADGKHTTVRYHVYDHRADPELKKVDVKPLCAGAPAKGGYTIEALIPWESLAVTPELGTEVGVQVILDDADAEEERVFNSVWYPGVGTFMDTSRMHSIRLAEKASAPVLAVGRLGLEGYSCIQARAFGDQNLVGKAIRVEAQGEVLGSGTFKAGSGRAVAAVELPIPPAGQAWPHVDFLMGDRLVERLALPDLERAREKALRRLNLEFDSYCFPSETLPVGHFPDPREVANLLGKHTIRATYYDAAYNEVTKAETPGRYAVCLNVIPEKGQPLHRLTTLFQLPPGADPLPAADDPRQQAREMAHRAEMDPEEVETNRNNAWSREQRWMHGLKKKLGILKPYPYLVQTPKQAETNKTGTFPAILYLHGSGGGDVALEALNKSPITQFLLEHPEFPFYVFTPQCPNGEWWGAPKLDDLYDEIIAKYPVDPERLYLTGLSLGGYGTWMYAGARPERFAAIAPICGGGDPREAAFWNQLPVWVFHGAKDPTVPVRKSTEMVEALRVAGGRVRFTTYTDGGHTIWDRAYKNPELYKWFLGQTRGKPTFPPGVDLIQEAD